MLESPSKAVFIFKSNQLQADSALGLYVVAHGLLWGWNQGRQGPHAPVFLGRNSSSRLQLRMALEHFWQGRL